MLSSITAVIAPLDRWTEKEQTQAEVETFITQVRHFLHVSD
jgi:type I restriction enzyme R subunit